MRQTQTKYDLLRVRKVFPTVWCPGCGDGSIMKAIVRAIEGLGIPGDDLVLVSGIGCSSRTPVYLDACTLHTTHGRPLPFATGVKLARPELNVMVITGDGDALAIGGNHFIHTCRRNIDITCLIYNNWTYGMTGGQFSPTTPVAKYATTAPYGVTEKPFDICTLAQASGATFVARGTVYHLSELERLITDGIRHHGFAVIEIIQQCPVYFGRDNKMGSAVEMLNWQKETFVAKQRWDKMTDEERQGKLPRGVLHHAEAPEYVDEYKKLVASVQAQMAEKAAK